MLNRPINVVLVDVKDIEIEDSVQPSSHFIESVRKHGVKEPPVLRLKADGSGYLIDDGRRRIAAMIELGMKEIPAVVQDMDTSDDRDVVALLLNLQRTHNPGVEVESIKRLINKGLTQKEIADEISIPLPKLRKLFSMVNLRDEARRMLKKGELSMSAACVLSKLPKEQQEKILADNEKVSLKTVLAAKREFALSGSKALFEVVSPDSSGEETIEEMIMTDPLSKKLKELIVLIKSTKRMTPEVESAIETFRLFINKNIQKEVIT